MGKAGRPSVKPRNTTVLRSLTLRKCGGVAGLAKKIGTNHAVITQWADGKQDIPGDWLERVAKALNVDESLLRARVEDVCLAHIRIKPCAPCRTVGEKVGKIRRDPAFAKKYAIAILAWDKVWTLEEDAILKSHAGKENASCIVERINEWRRARDLCERTVGAVYCRAEKLGIYLLPDSDFASTRTACKLLGCGDQTIARFRELGWIDGFAWGGKGWLIRMSDLEAFIRERPWAVQIEHMQPGPLRDLADTLTKRDPYVSTSVIARLTGVSNGTVRRYARFGVIRSYKRPSPGSHGDVYTIPVSEVETIAELRGMDRLAA